MAIFKPFKAVRPPRDKAHLVSSRSYITYGKKELFAKLSENPFSFIHIINPEYRERIKTPPNSEERFQAVKNKYNEFVNKGYFQRDKKPAFYLYRQISGKNSYCGLVGCCAVDDYLEGNIKIHEHTLAPREEIFKRYLDTTGFHAEPVLMSHKDHEEIERVKNIYLETRAEYDFSTTDKNRHQLWVIDDPEHIATLTGALGEIPELYIADGHHRSASSVKLAQEKRALEPNYPKGFDFILSYLIPESELEILPFHRLVKDNIYTDLNDILKKLQRSFEITEVGPNVKPTSNKEVLFLSWEKNFLLKLREEVSLIPPLETISPDWVSTKILEPVFDIKDLRTDSRIEFLGGKFSVAEVKNIIKKRAIPYAFYLYPVQVEELKAVADAGLSMPPKSTFIEPKLRSGVTVYEMN
ncbi:DUF1015 domain-containing protein [Luteibaculum oceani]|uniref:DUF1015 domain-containing protein n=1 Tax=Luteibaculum oceani TaxID=1294296 RepID=A0A5C6UU93_9FLAO|nr:DUF1015 domain-containing protein [Luteibaculum oceani]TXC76932.1 DUF1015 domain-containing protein [Luteibaculum oceani]